MTAEELALRLTVAFSKKLLIVDRCLWAGYEADLLIVEPAGRRLIDVEIKTSRADLRADAQKGKWKAYDWKSDIAARREWPRRVWKHYYAMPREVWKPELLSTLGSPRSGVLLWDKSDTGFSVERRAQTNRDAHRLTDAEVLQVARLATLRLWDARAAMQRLIAEQKEGK